MASEITRRRPGGLTETSMEHKDAGVAWVPSHRVDHYKLKGWKPAKSTADRPTNPAPQGADTASTKEG